MVKGCYNLCTRKNTWILNAINVLVAAEIHQGIEFKGGEEDVISKSSSPGQSFLLLDKPQYGERYQVRFG